LFELSFFFTPFFLSPLLMAEIITSTRQRLTTAKLNASPSSMASDSKTFRLTMYKTPPQEEVTLDQFEQLAMDRLKGIGGISLSPVSFLVTLSHFCCLVIQS
jgi:hypothetical protein